LPLPILPTSAILTTALSEAGPPIEVWGAGRELAAQRREGREPIKIRGAQGGEKKDGGEEK
jgi:hypothetical protein